MALMICPLHGYQCGGNCMAASQQMGMADYHRYLNDQMGRAMQQQIAQYPASSKETKKPNKKLLLIQR